MAEAPVAAKPEKVKLTKKEKEAAEIAAAQAKGVSRRGLGKFFFLLTLSYVF